jgi:hypothetical protein
MERHGEAWGGMGKHEEAWNCEKNSERTNRVRMPQTAGIMTCLEGCIGRHEGVWEGMGRHGEACGCMERHGEARGGMDRHGYMHVDAWI